VYISQKEVLNFSFQPEGKVVVVVELLVVLEDDELDVVDVLEELLELLVVELVVEFVLVD
jgi:hypothetical protein